MTLKKGNFITLHYTGIKTEDNAVFDTTQEDVAKKHSIHNPKMAYEPITVCIGEGHILPGLDKKLEGRELGKHTIELTAENAFGKKRSDLLKLMPKKLFDKQKIRIAPGLQVTIDDMPGTIKSISGNRVVVDFNHALAGHELTYEIDIQEQITDTQKQVETLVHNTLRFPAKITIQDKTASVELPIDLPEEIQTELNKKTTELTEITQVEYTKKNA